MRMRRPAYLMTAGLTSSSPSPTPPTPTPEKSNRLLQWLQASEGRFNWWAAIVLRMRTLWARLQQTLQEAARDEWKTLKRTWDMLYSITVVTVERTLHLVFTIFKVLIVLFILLLATHWFCFRFWPGVVNIDHEVLGGIVSMVNGVLGVLHDILSGLASVFYSMSSGVQEVPFLGSMIAGLLRSIANKISGVHLPSFTESSISPTLADFTLHDCSGYASALGYGWRLLQTITGLHIGDNIDIDSTLTRVGLSLALAAACVVVFFIFRESRKRWDPERAMVETVTPAVWCLRQGMFYTCHQARLSWARREHVFAPRRNLDREAKWRAFFESLFVIAPALGLGIWQIVVRPVNLSHDLLGWLGNDTLNDWCLMEQCYYGVKLLAILVIVCFAFFLYHRPLFDALVVVYLQLRVWWILLLWPLLRFVVWDLLVMETTYAMLWVVENCILFLWAFRLCFRHRLRPKL